MQRRSVQFSLRWILAFVLISAIAVEIEVWRRRMPICQSHAARCTLAEKAHLRMAACHERIANLYRQHAADPRQSSRYNREQAALFARAALSERTEAWRAADRRASFRSAALLPWLAIPTVEPDPLGTGLIEREEQVSR